MDLLIKRGYTFGGNRIWNVGKNLASGNGTIFYVFFEMSYREGESNEDVWGRAVNTFAERLRVAPIE